jgi:cobalt-zinc-cadmium resistance protein CzcA
VQDWIVAPQMRSPGLAGVDTIGGYVKEYAVHPGSRAHWRPMASGSGDLVRALERANVQAGAGFVQRAGEGLVVRADALAQNDR